MRRPQGNPPTPVGSDHKQSRRNLATLTELGEQIDMIDLSASGSPNVAWTRPGAVVLLRGGGSINFTEGRLCLDPSMAFGEAPLEIRTAHVYTFVLPSRARTSTSMFLARSVIYTVGSTCLEHFRTILDVERGRRIHYHGRHKNPFHEPARPPSEVSCTRRLQ